MKRLLLATLLALPAACSCSEEEPAPARPKLSSEEMVKQMYAVVDEQAPRPELPLSEVTVQHILIGVKGGVVGATRSPGEAEELVAELYARAKDGEDFDLLVKNYTNDAHHGIYHLVTSGGDDVNRFERAKMVPALGDVGWRLQVGELGVAVYDGGLPGGSKKSPLGYHLIKRLE